MASPRIGGGGIPLNLTGALGAQLPNTTASAALQFSPARGSNTVDLAAGQILQLGAGTYLAALGTYTSLLWFDPVTGIYRPVAALPDRASVPIDSDGGNYQLGNLTGCPVGALITTAGTLYTNGIGSAQNGLVVTASAGGSVWVAVTGGAINSTIAITAAGQNYLYPPILVIDAPPTGGIQATAVCTISAGAINAVTVNNQGAGYVTAPNITLIRDPRDTTGNGGILTVNATLAGSGGLTALYPSNYGTSLTAVPTFTFTVQSGFPGSGAAATAVMNFVVTGFTVNSGASGAGYGNAQPFLILTTGDVIATAAAANTAGPIAGIGLTRPRMARVEGVSTAGGLVTAVNAVIGDAGFGIQQVPKAVVLAGGTGLATTVGQVTLTVGGVTDRSWVQPI